MKKYSCIVLVLFLFGALFLIPLKSQAEMLELGYVETYEIESQGSYGITFNSLNGNASHSYPWGSFEQVLFAVERKSFSMANMEARGSRIQEIIRGMAKQTIYFGRTEKTIIIIVN